MASTYNELSINEKINLKTTLQAWAKYAIVDFQQELDDKVYGLRTSKKGVQRSSLGAGYRFGSKKGRTNALRRTWYQTVNAGMAVDNVMIQFLMHGRFLDMGVGRGTSHTDRLVTRSLKLGKAARQRRAWYSKRKTYEIHRLREILQQKNITIGLGAIENAMNLAVQLNF
jgi:hypothetical protein